MSAESKRDFRFITCPAPQDPRVKVRSGVLIQVGIPIWVQEPGVARTHYMGRTAATIREVPVTKPRIK